MAEAEKAVTRKRSKASSEKASYLRQRSDPRHERRFEPKTSTLAVLSVLGMSIGALLAGAGTYGQWFRAAEYGPFKWAPYLLGAGAVFLIGVAIFGPKAAAALRVGDAGVASEASSAEIDRIGWRDITRVRVDSGGAITVQSPGHSITVPYGAHPAGCARLMFEAKARIPKRVESAGDVAFEKPSDDDGELLPLDLPQVAGTYCKKSEKLIAFERDARLCGRCGEVYHKDSVPKACLTCDAKLRV